MGLTGSVCDGSIRKAVWPSTVSSFLEGGIITIPFNRVESNTNTLEILIIRYFLEYPDVF